MSDIEYSVIKREARKSFDCISLLYRCTAMVDCYFVIIFSMAMGVLEKTSRNKS